MSLHSNMKLGGWLPALVLLAAGCDSDSTSSEHRQSNRGDPVDPGIANISISPGEAARLRTRAAAALAAVLPGAGGAA